MATKLLPLRPILRPIHTHHQRRTFLSALTSSITNNTNNKPLRINVTRTLPHTRTNLYNLIVDVDAYASFLPYCQHSRVTARDPHSGAPTEGELTVGFGPLLLTQSYTSRIVCEPGRSVEALSGGQVLQHKKNNTPFKKLVTKWTVADVVDAGKQQQQERPLTRVDLDVEMVLEDALLQMVLDKVVEETAGKMVDAFEKRAEQLYGRR